ncbi:CoA-transferase family III [Panus rudis PR-1116 ss-1]|nr:CoA-transferase family III [Panus rudis PR-1116 ss-1]
MSKNSMSQGPLSGLRVVEFAGLAPGPFAGLILADWGADVIRVDRPTFNAGGNVTEDVLARGKRSVAIDPKTPSGYANVKSLINTADVLLEPFRPGVMERLGFGPEVFLGDEGSNKKLVYARLVGFPRGGSHSQLAGHDLNYLALSGVLSLLPGTPDRPTFPLNLLADFAAGGLSCALGILLALYERKNSGVGQVVDNDMVSGTRYISTFALVNSFQKPHPSDLPTKPVFSPATPTPQTRMRNTLDDGAPFYTVYTCADGRWMSVGCIEPKFYQIFLGRFLGALEKDERDFMKRKEREGGVPKLEDQFVREKWEDTRAFFTEGFKLRGRDYWEGVYRDSDACTFPVLSPLEAAKLASTTIIASAQPHPHLSRTPAPGPQSGEWDNTTLAPGKHTREVLKEIGMGEDEVEKLIKDQVVSVWEEQGRGKSKL